MPTLAFRTLAADPTAARFAVTVPADLLYFQGHFPGAPILPAIAQLLTLVQDRVQFQWPDLGQPRRVARLKFMRAIDPGDEIEVHLERTGAEVRFALSRRNPSEPARDADCTRGTLAYA